MAFQEFSIPIRAVSSLLMHFDSVNRALDTIIVERFWRSLKYEDISIKDYHTLAELKLGVSRYSMFYNSERFHQSLHYETPDSIYASKFPVRKLEIAS